MGKGRKKTKSFKRRIEKWNVWPVNTVITLVLTLSLLAMNHVDIDNRGRGSGLAAVVALLALWNTVISLMYVKSIIRDEIKAGPIILRYFDLFLALTLSYGGVYTVGYILDDSASRTTQVLNETEISGVYGVYFASWVSALYAFCSAGNVGIIPKGLAMTMWSGWIVLMGYIYRTFPFMLIFKQWNEEWSLGKLVRRRFGEDPDTRTTTLSKKTKKKDLGDAVFTSVMDAEFGNATIVQNYTGEWREQKSRK